MTKSKVVEELWAALIQSTRIWRGPFWSYPSVPSSQLHPQQPPQSQARPTSAPGSSVVCPPTHQLLTGSASNKRAAQGPHTTHSSRGRRPRVLAG